MDPAWISSKSFFSVDCFHLDWLGLVSAGGLRSLCRSAASYSSATYVIASYAHLHGCLVPKTYIIVQRAAFPSRLVAPPSCGLGHPFDLWCLRAASSRWLGILIASAKQMFLDRTGCGSLLLILQVSGVRSHIWLSLALAFTASPSHSSLTSRCLAASPLSSPRLGLFIDSHGFWLVLRWHADLARPGPALGLVCLHCQIYLVKISSCLGA